MTTGWAWFGADNVEEFDHLRDLRFDGWLYVAQKQAEHQRQESFNAEVRKYNLAQFNLPSEKIAHYAAQAYDAVQLFAHAATQLLAEGQNLHNIFPGMSQGML